MIRILIIHNTLNDSTSVSGVLLHYAYMANEWIAMGHKVDFLTAKVGWAQLTRLAPQAGRLSSDSFFNANRYLHQTWRYFPAYFLRLASAHWLRMAEPYDIVYASGQLIFEVYPALVLARRLGCPWAVKIQHMLAAQAGRVGLFDRLFLGTERQSIRWMNRHAALILCMTPIVAKDYHAVEARLGLPRRETRQIGCGIDIAGFQYAPETPKQYDAVFLGRMHQHKGIFDLPKVWQKVVQHKPQAKLVVIGEGPHRLQAQRIFQKLGLGDSVVFTGGIDEQRKQDLLAQSRIGVSLSYEEGWGLSVTEYLAAGLPVVAYQLPVFPYAFPDLLDLVALGNVDAFAEVLLRLVNDPERRNRMGVTGHDFVRRYDYRHIAHQELAALQEVIRDR